MLQVQVTVSELYAWIAQCDLESWVRCRYKMQGLPSPLLVFCSSFPWVIFQTEKLEFGEDTHNNTQGVVCSFCSELWILPGNEQEASVWSSGLTKSIQWAPPVDVDFCLLLLFEKPKMPICDKSCVRVVSKEVCTYVVCLSYYLWFSHSKTIS